MSQLMQVQIDEQALAACSQQERLIVAAFRELHERGDFGGAWRILSNQTGRSLQRRGIIAAYPLPTGAEPDDPA